MKSNSYLAVESLFHISENLLRQTGRVGYYRPYFSTFRPLDYNSWYCRTHVHTCPVGQEEALTRRLAEGVRRGQLPWLLSVSEEDVPAAFFPALEQAGFSVRKPQTGMLLETRSYQPAPADPHVVRIGPDQIGAWAAVCTQAFGKGDETPAMRLLIGEPMPRAQFYAYLHDGAIAATLMMYLQPGNASLHEVGTLAQFRGRGYCTALLHRAFTDAKTMGYPLVTLQASVLGAPVYRRVGMVEISHLRNYYLLP